MTYHARCFILFPQLRTQKCTENRRERKMMILIRQYRRWLPAVTSPAPFSIKNIFSSWLKTFRPPLNLTIWSRTTRNTCYESGLTWSAATRRSGWGTGFLSRTPARCHPSFSSSPCWPVFAGCLAGSPACVRPPVGGCWLRWAASFFSHDMIGFVLRKMAASVRHRAKGGREGGREVDGWREGDCGGGGGGGRRRRDFRTAHQRRLLKGHWRAIRACIRAPLYAAFVDVRSCMCVRVRLGKMLYSASMSSDFVFELPSLNCANHTDKCQIFMGVKLPCRGGATGWPGVATPSQSVSTSLATPIARRKFWYVWKFLSTSLAPGQAI